MKTLPLWVAAFVALSAAAVQGQERLVGTWQGTLQAGRPLRVVIQISTTPASTLTGVMYSIDQGGQALAASAISLQGTSVAFAIPGAGASYEGKLSPDGTAIVGTFTQGGNPLALNLTRATGDAAWAIPAAPAAMSPMAASVVPAFDVVTIKPSKPDAPGKLFTVRGHDVVTINTTLNDLITFAYGLQSQQITGGAPWLATDKYDVTGQPDAPGVPSQAQLRTLLQKLLADRFKLMFHRERKELSVYALVVGSKGPMLTSSSGDPNGLPSLLFRGLGLLPVRNATMADLAEVMQGAVLDRPVVDHTGLTGHYDFTLTWTPDETQFAAMGVRVPPPTGDPKAAPGLFTAIQEQLGLRLEATKSPVEVMVVDHVERPSDN